MDSPPLPPLFTDWTPLGIDPDGEPVHEPTPIANNVLGCRCQRDDCLLDSALFRARMSGFVQAIETVREGRDVADVIEDPHWRR